MLDDPSPSMLAIMIELTRRDLRRVQEGRRRMQQVQASVYRGCPYKTAHKTVHDWEFLYEQYDRMEEEARERVKEYLQRSKASPE